MDDSYGWGLIKVSLRTGADQRGPQSMASFGWVDLNGYDCLSLLEIESNLPDELALCTLRYKYPTIGVLDCPGEPLDMRFPLNLLFGKGHGSTNWIVRKDPQPVAVTWLCFTKV